MPKEVRHIYAILKPCGAEWLVFNMKNQVLGDIAYYKPWKKFVFYPIPCDRPISEVWFSAECLEEIAEKLDYVNSMSKKQIKELRCKK